MEDIRARLKTYLRENFQFIIICLLWFITGAIFTPAALVLVPVTVILLYLRGYEKEIFIGLLFVLTMSDNRLASANWAADVKNIYIVLFALIVMKNFKSYENKIKLHLYILPFIIIAAICILYSPSPSTAVQKTLSYFLLFLSVPNYFTYLYSKHGSQFLKEIIWAIFFLLLIGLVLKLVGSSVISLAGRYRGILGNPNGLGIYCFLFMIFFAIVNEFFSDLFTRNQKIFIYFVITLSLILCGARSSLLAVIIFFVFRYFHRLSPVFGFIILIIFTGTYELILTNLESIIYAAGLQEFARVDTIKDGSGRLVAWAFAWENINRNLFIGKGFSYTEYLYVANYEYLSKLGHQGAAHNAYLTFWLDTGFLGLAAFMSGFLGFMFSLSKLSVSLFPLLYAILFSNQFESWLTASLNPFTILLLCSISLIYAAGIEKKLIQKDRETPTEPDPGTIIAA
ncbi:MAG: O-antigen polymerase [Bacteroidetes bacterium]|nr:O-antigen polymerase [Bacteroidota bacterium]